MHKPSFPRSTAVLQRAVDARAFPCAVVEVGSAAGALWTEAFGRTTYEEDASMASASTVFDLASLTKVLCTTSLAMRHVEGGRIDIERPVADLLAEWRGTDRAIVTVRDLLAHCSGLTAYLPLFRDHRGRREFEHAICSLPLEYTPRTASIYSDLGFILLGFVLEDAARAPLDAQFEALRTEVAPDAEIAFTPPAAWRPRTAPTEQDPWRGRLLVGEVHDENAWALGGVAAHAGLFGTAAAVGAWAAHLLRILAGQRGAFSRDLVASFAARRSNVPGSSRALGWDTMLPTSSCGTRLSPRAFGHTGFTGTSLWIDPDRVLYVVLLTNRVYPTRTNEGIRTVRAALHDAAVEDLGAAASNAVR